MPKRSRRTAEATDAAIAELTNARNELEEDNAALRERVTGLEQELEEERGQSKRLRTRLSEAAAEVRRIVCVRLRRLLRPTLHARKIKVDTRIKLNFPASLLSRAFPGLVRGRSTTSAAGNLTVPPIRLYSLTDAAAVLGIDAVERVHRSGVGHRTVCRVAFVAQISEDWNEQHPRWISHDKCFEARKDSVVYVHRWHRGEDAYASDDDVMGTGALADYVYVQSYDTERGYVHRSCLLPRKTLAVSYRNVCRRTVILALMARRTLVMLPMPSFLLACVVYPCVSQHALSFTFEISKFVSRSPFVLPASWSV